MKKMLLFGGILLIPLLWPLPRTVRDPAPPRTVRITDRAGLPLYDLRPEDEGAQRTIALEAMPQSFLRALVAVEDRTFFAHGGVSIRGIARAAWQNLRAGKIVAGGSTLTQQLVRIRLQPKRRTVFYKMKEALYAWKLERIRSKEEILAAYANEAYFGHRAYGIAAAARTFFGKAPLELSLAESALLAGLVQSPSALDPFVNFEGATRRQAHVLAALRATRIISAEEEEDTLQEPLRLSSARVPIRAPHFALWLPQARPEAFLRGTEVRTTLDLPLQTAIERIVERRVEELKDRNVTSAAVVVLDAARGDLLAMVGSADYFDGGNDGAVNVALSPRQPGSTIKPFTYALALAHGNTAATTIADVETQFFTQEGNPYIPRNYDYGFHGLVRYREALANSYNIAAVKVLEKVGVPALLEFLRSAGVTTLTQTPEHYGLALTLGDAEVTLLDLATAYAMFPRGGRTLAVRLLSDDPVVPGERILDERIAWLITDILSDASARLPEFGENSPLTFDRPVAAKTGTTRNARDNWVVGYSADRVVGVWVGNADNSPMRGTSGVTGAGPIFHDVMLASMNKNLYQDFKRPEGMNRVTICRLSGKIPTPDCPQTVEEWFLTGTEPTEKDDLFRFMNVDRRNGLLASGDCVADVIESRLFMMFPPELTTWARENGYATPPTQISPLCGRASSSVRNSSSVTSSADHAVRWLSILKPQPGDSFRLDPLIPDASERVVFKANASGDIRTVRWFVNGREVGQGISPEFRFDWQPSSGVFTIEARGGGFSDRRTITVEE